MDDIRSETKRLGVKDLKLDRDKAVHLKSKPLQRNLRKQTERRTVALRLKSLGNGALARRQRKRINARKGCPRDDGFSGNENWCSGSCSSIFWDAGDGKDDFSIVKK